MGKFNKGDKFGGNKRFDNDRGFRREGRSDRPEMHQAICSDCGRDCEVPFRPSGDKPVYCSDCFKSKNSSSKDRREERNSGRPNFGGKQMFEAVCDKCRKDCEVPFRPTGDKPVYCSDCFGKSERSGGGNKSAASSDQYKKQFETINSKLDYILKLLSPKNSVEKAEASKTRKHENTKTQEKDVKKAKVLKKVVVPKKAVKKAIKKKK